MPNRKLKLQEKLKASSRLGMIFANFDDLAIFRQRIVELESLNLAISGSY